MSLQVFLARGHAFVIDAKQGRVMVDLGDVVSLAEAEGKVVTLFMDRANARVERGAFDGLVLVCRFADIEARASVSHVVENGSPAPAGSWSFARCTPTWGNCP